MNKTEQPIKGYVEGTLTQIKDNEIVDKDRLYLVTDITSGITNTKMEALLANPVLAAYYTIDDIFVCIDEGTYTKGAIYRWTGDSWEELAAVPEIDLSNYYTKLEVDSLLPKITIVED